MEFAEVILQMPKRTGKSIDGILFFSSDIRNEAWNEV